MPMIFTQIFEVVGNTDIIPFVNKEQMVKVNAPFRLRAHGGCDRSAEDAYSSMAPDPTFALSEVRVALHSILYVFFRL